MSDNRNQAIIMAVGVGAVGTILAYLGYSIFSDETNKEKMIEVSNDIGEELENKESLLTTEINDDNKEKPSIFYSFWNSTFNNSDEKKKDDENEDEDDENVKSRYHY
jgi:hypothetical protein